MYRLSTRVESQKLQQVLNGAVRKGPQLIANALNKVAYDTESTAKGNAPVGVTSSLRNSITVERATPATLRSKVGTNIKYAAAVEKGSKPHMPPVAALKRWAQVKLGNANLAYAVANKIRKQGTKGQYYFRKAKQTLQQAGTLKREIERTIAGMLKG